MPAVDPRFGNHRESVRRKQVRVRTMDLLVRLIIVESPKKARTLASFAGSGYRVIATMGHVRDLPAKALGVEIGDAIVPHYEVIARARRTLTEIRAAARNADTVYLATDPDREGEAIAWHVAEAAGLPASRTSRITFHEISERALRAALARPRTLDSHLVDAQQARRILDRLVGYGLSPLLWRAIQRGTSGGRVQSVALRIIVDRERQVRAFVPEEFWTVDVALSSVALAEDDVEERFVARLIQIGDEPARIGAEAHAHTVTGPLETALFRAVSFEHELSTSPPPPPFTTSTLQQAVSSRFRIPAKRTMQIAQSLYEAGLITYMRTDSVAVAPEAVQAVRAVIASDFGPGALHASPRVFRTRARNAQEAHEAIRPVDPSKRPSMLTTLARGDEGRVYGLIWSRMVASQMASARLRTDRATVEALCATPIPIDGPDGHRVTTRLVLEARATSVVSAGWLAVYGEAADHRPMSNVVAGRRGGDTPGSAQVEAESDDLPLNASVPELVPGAIVAMQSVQATQRFTRPPARFTEATLVRALEAAGVGRPSTYATILTTILERGYVGQSNRAFVPTTLGFAVNDYLALRFPDVVDVQFTAKMEDRLDEVASGERDWQSMLGEFQLAFAQAITEAGATATADRRAVARSVADATTDGAGETHEVPRATSANARRVGVSSPVESDDAHVAKLAKSSDPLPRRRQSTPPTAGVASQALEATKLDDAPATSVGPALHCPACGKPMVVRRSKFGEFWGCSGYPKCRTIHRDGADEAAPAGTAGPPKPVARRRAATPVRQQSVPPYTDNPAPSVSVDDTRDGSPPGEPLGSDGPPACAKCGKPMVTRRSRFGEFWGCSGYPACREIRAPAGNAELVGTRGGPRATRARRGSASSQRDRPDPMTARVVRARGTYRRPGTSVT